MRRIALLYPLLLAACATSTFTEPSIERDLLAYGGVATNAAYRGYADETQDADGSALAAPKDARKMIRTGSVGITVDDWKVFRTSLDAQLAEIGGFVSDTTLHHQAGQVSDGTLVVRVPSDKLDELVAWTEGGTEIRYVDLRSQDVTREWSDLQARIENGQREERALLELLDNRTASLADVLAVERELARVRGEVEEAQRVSRGMAEQIDLATLTVDAQVRAQYHPVVAQTFGEEASDSFFGAVTAMGELGRELTLSGIAALPWLGVLALGLGAFGLTAYGGVRTLVRAARKSAA